MRKSYFLLAVLTVLGLQVFGQVSATSDSLRVIEMERQNRSLKNQLNSLQGQIEELRSQYDADRDAVKRKVEELQVRDSVLDAERRIRILKGKENAVGYPVAPFGDTLFMVFGKIGPVMPEDRARNVEERILALLSIPNFEADSISVIEGDLTADIVYHDLIIMSVTDWDAIWADQQLLVYAQNCADRIIDGIKSSEKSRSTWTIAKRIGWVLLILTAIMILLNLLNRVYRRIKKWVITNREKIFIGLRFKNYEFLNADRMLSVALFVTRLGKWLTFALIIYLSLPVLFSIFPFTQGWAETLLGLILKPAKDALVGIWNYVPNMITIVVIYLITRYVVRFLKFFATEIEEKRLVLTGFHADWALPTFNIVRILLFAFMFIVIFPYLPGSQSPIFRGVSVFLGILFSLGSSSAIANAVAGLVITYMRPFQIGDRVKIGEIVGDVVERSMLVTRIRTTKNEDITIPNSSIMSGHTTNFTTSSKELGLVLHTSVTIGYDVPWRQVHQLLTDAAKATEWINKEIEPFVLQTSLDDWYVSYQLNAYTNAPEKMPKIYSQLHANIQDGFNAAGVEIMSPHYRAVRDGNASTIPPSS